jgi:hypothetical protein
MPSQEDDTDPLHATILHMTDEGLGSDKHENGHINQKKSLRSREHMATVDGDGETCNLSLLITVFRFVLV